MDHGTEAKPVSFQFGTHVRIGHWITSLVHDLNVQWSLAQGVDAAQSLRAPQGVCALSRIRAARDGQRARRHGFAVVEQTDVGQFHALGIRAQMDGDIGPALGSSAAGEKGIEQCAPGLACSCSVGPNTIV